MKRNENIKQFLDDYVSHIEPGFAVMLTGNWGCGKTHFIENYREEKQEKTKDSFLYVSLNGLKSTEQIDSEIFSVLHPVMASKGMKLLTSVLLSGISKFGFDIKEGMFDGTKIEASIPKVNVIDLFDNIVSKTLIFDDLERCLLSPSETLGYINKYVEQNKLRVIIIANEDEIDESEKLQKDFEQKNNADNAHLAKIENNQNQSKYKIIKEKLIGKSFRIQGDIDSALESFIKKYTEKNGSFPDTVIRNNIHIIKEVYTTFGKDNLRILMQTFYDWRIFWNHLDDKVKGKNDLIQQLIQIFFIFSFEIKAGFNPEKLRNLEKDFIDNFHEQKNKTVSNEENTYTVFGKYGVSFISSNSLIISVENWVYFFVNGIPNKEAITKELLQSEYFFKENTPAWKKLQSFRDISDEDFLKLFTIIENEIKAHEIKNPEIFLEILKTYLYLLENNLFPGKKNKEQVMKEMKYYILEMGKKGYLSDPNWLANSSCGFYGLRFQMDNSDFLKIFKFLRYQIKKKSKPFYQEEAKKLLGFLIEKNPEQFKLEIYHNPNYTYAEFPIFTYFNASEFLNVITELDNPQIQYLSYLFKNRYNGNASQLLTELEFLRDLKQGIELKIEGNSDKPIQNLSLNQFIIALTDGIDKLQSYKSNLTLNKQEMISR